ncbi:MAG: ATP-grasp domain-containing protein [Myxococcales bacterium]|nr:ATP-grasp domain-containing protein [Myxococcales bacterium]
MTQQMPRSPLPRGRRKRLKIAILYNVDFADSSPEGDPGWAARADVEAVARSVSDALSAGPADVELIPIDGDLTSLRDRLVRFQPDSVFNLCESICGDARLESALPLIVELLGFPITGSPAEVLSLSLHKDRVKAVLVEAGVPTPESCVMTHADAPCSLPFPVIVKPVREDGSVGIQSRSVVHDEASLRSVVADVVREYRQPCIVERFIDGRELNVALLGFPSARVLPLSEIDFALLPAGVPKIVSYDAKWTADSPEYKGTQPVLHPELPASVAARVRRVALEAFRAVGLRDYGRVDIRLSPDGVPYVVDVNPNCDLSPTAGMARAAGAVGIDYEALVRLVGRYSLRRRMKEERDEQHSQAGARGSIAPR